jgi:hypothetical protein
MISAGMDRLKVQAGDAMGKGFSATKARPLPSQRGFIGAVKYSG